MFRHSGSRKHAPARIGTGNLAAVVTDWPQIQNSHSNSNAGEKALFNMVDVDFNENASCNDVTSHWIVIGKAGIVFGSGYKGAIREFIVVGFVI